jgi:hypothetical protein
MFKVLLITIYCRQNFARILFPQQNLVSIQHDMTSCWSSKFCLELYIVYRTLLEFWFLSRIFIYEALHVSFLMFKVLLRTEHVQQHSSKILSTQQNHLAESFLFYDDPQLCHIKFNTILLRTDNLQQHSSRILSTQQNHLFIYGTLHVSFLIFKVLLRTIYCRQGFFRILWLHSGPATNMENTEATIVTTNQRSIIVCQKLTQIRKNTE